MNLLAGPTTTPAAGTQFWRPVGKKAAYSTTEQEHCQELRRKFRHVWGGNVAAMKITTPMSRWFCILSRASRCPCRHAVDQFLCFPGIKPPGRVVGRIIEAVADLGG